SHVRTAARRPRGGNGVCPPDAARLRFAVAGLAGAGGPLRGEHQPAGGSERQGWMARLRRRIRRGSEGFGPGAEGHRGLRRARGDRVTAGRVEIGPGLVRLALILFASSGLRASRSRSVSRRWSSRVWLSHATETGQDCGGAKVIVAEA